jgi:hypothetical protein
VRAAIPFDFSTWKLKANFLPKKKKEEEEEEEEEEHLLKVVCNTC